MSKSSADNGERRSNNRPEDGGDGVESWRELLNEIEPGLRRFLGGKLPQAADVDDCIQSVSVAMLKNKTEIPRSARRAWL